MSIGTSSFGVPSNTTIGSSQIADDTIVNADVNSAAAIAANKLNLTNPTDNANDVGGSANRFKKGYFSSDLQTDGFLICNTVGKGLKVKEGSNARMGTATLINGTVTVSTTAVGASSRIFLTRSAPAASTAIGALSIGTVVGGTSFVINALNVANATVLVADVSVVSWMIVEPA